jgi:hypothetical protein
MGREIRRVPPNWKHPRTDKYGEERYQPMHDNLYSKAAKEWMENCLLWEKGEHPSQKSDWAKECKYYWEYEGNPPDKEYYLPDGLEEPTWYQMYETVSEGTPVSPPFATREELIDYLVENGDFWDQKRGTPPPTRESVEAFVDMGWAPSFIVADGKLMSGVEAASVKFDQEKS